MTDSPTSVLRERADLLPGAVLALLAVLAVDLGVTAPVPGLLALAGLFATAGRLAWHRGRGPLDTLLVAVGGALVALVLTGLVLNLTGPGLQPRDWALAVASVTVLGSVAGLLAPRTTPPTQQAEPARWVTLRAVPWLAAAVAVVVVAVGVSVHSLSATDRPPLAMSFGAVHGTDVQVVVTAGEAVGRLELRTSSDGTDVSYPLFDVAADGTRTTTLSLPRHGRYVVTLNYPDQTQPLRTLILDR